MQKVLITGIDSFTGTHLSRHLKKSDYDVYGTSLFKGGDQKYKCDITNKDDVLKVLQSVKPDYIIHLSAISFVGHGKDEEFYRVNTIGTTNILDALLELKIKPLKTILVSSATVYGNQGLEILDESLCPQPANHYGASKYAMESLAKGYFDKLPIIITRPFNYTGVGQAENFLIPKIVSHFKEAKRTIELGNLHVSREFNDIHFICEVYQRLLETTNNSQTLNIATNRGIKLLDVIDMMQEIAGYEIEVKVNPAFVRPNEIKSLTGSPKKLFEIIGTIELQEFQRTLTEMYEA